MMMIASGAYGARPDVSPIGVLLGADGGELGSGLNVCNIPVGDDGYVQSYLLSSKAPDVVSQIQKSRLGSATSPTRSGARCTT